MSRKIFKSVYKNTCSKSNNIVLMYNWCKSNLNFIKKKIILSGLKQSFGAKIHIVTIHNPYKKNKKMILQKKILVCKMYSKLITIMIKEL